MKGRFIIIPILLILLSAFQVYGVTVHGTIYDEDLDPVKQVVVEVNSTPLQRHVSKYGGYSFDLNPGVYQLTAIYSNNGSSLQISDEIVNIKSGEGDYIVDLFIYPNINLSKDIVKEENPFTTWFFNKGYLWVLGISIFLFVVLFIAFFTTLFKYTQKKKTSHSIEYNIQYSPDEENNTPSEIKEPQIETISEDDKLKKRILKIIEESDNQITQKNIRKKIDLSESKISQVISELAKEKKIKKIKKGRMNYITIV